MATREGINPEELIGAAHAGCFSMFLAAAHDSGLQAGTHLPPRPRFLGLHEKTFQEKIEVSKHGCPVSSLALT